MALLVQDKDSMAVGYKTACWTTSEWGALEAFNYNVQAVTTFRYMRYDFDTIIVVRIANFISVMIFDR